MLKRAIQSLYIKIFLSFLATCILFFVALAIFWNSFYARSFYQEKREFMELRKEELARVYQLYNEGSLATRELRISLRIIAKSINGEAWIVDSKGTIVVGSDNGWEGLTIPGDLDESFTSAMNGDRGFVSVRINHVSTNQKISYYTLYDVLDQGNQPYAIYLFSPVDDMLNTLIAFRWSIWVPLAFSLVAVALILFILSRRLAGPLQQMNLLAQSITEGDFTKRVPVRGQDEIGQLAQSFNRVLGRLQQWEDTRQEFLTNVSHELRSPLTTLRGLITGLNDGVIPSNQQSRYLGICIDEVKRLERLVSDLLDLARIQNSPDLFRPTILNAVKISEDIIDLVAPMIEMKGLSLEVWVPNEKEKPLYVYLDKDRYAQILNNLLYNAIQFTTNGNSIKVYFGRLDQTFLLQVSDTGVGMTEEELSRIWDRFYKADPSRGMNSEGTGLGLTIVHHLVKGMNGSIEVKSQINVGTEFTVKFPLVSLDRDEEI